MRLRSLAVPVLSAVLAVTLASCTSDGGAAKSSSAPGSSSGSAAAGGADTVALSQTLKAGLATLTSAHFTVDGTYAGQTFTASGDQKITDSTLAGLSAKATLPGIGSVAVVVDGTDRYVKLPPPIVKASTPWLKVTSGSTNIVVKQLAGFLDAALTAGSLGNLGGIADATTALRTVGREQVAGVAATHYSLVVDPAELPGGVATPEALGTKAIPVELWVDAQGRPVKVTAKLTVGGQAADTTIAFSDFGVPVTITAPPAAQVASG